LRLRRRRPRSSHSPAAALSGPGWLGQAAFSSVAAESARQVVLDFLLRVAAVLVAELHADAGRTLALRALRRHPDDPAGNRQLLFLAHEIEEHEHLVAQAVIAVRRDEQTAVAHERHVGEVECALVLDRERQQSWLVTWTSQ
jgi:hypothetical protein